MTLTPLGGLNKLFVLVALCLFGLSVVAQNNPVKTDGSSLNRTLSGENLSHHTDLFTGRFKYSVQIVVPPGRQGSGPKIDLGYSSSPANGWCGVGWALDMGHIQRETSEGVPIKWSATTPLNEYDDAKGFVFSSPAGSVRLVNIGGNEYRADVASASLKFTYVGPHWEMTDNNGSHFYFGNTADSRMENSKAGWASGLGKSTFRWGQNEAIDANGNKMSLTYVHDAGQMYLSTVSYNGNMNAPTLPSTHTIEFARETRTDKSISYQSGFRIETRERLSSIVVKVGTALVRRYALSYAYSPSTARSLLSSVVQYGTNDTDFLPAITFSYQVQSFWTDPGEVTTWTGVDGQGETGYEWNAPYHEGSSGGNVLAFMTDIDGDGLPDRVMRDAELPYVDFAVQFNNGHGFEAWTWWGPVDSQGGTSSPWTSPSGLDSDGNRVSSLVDLNRDGLPDRVMRGRSSPYWPFKVQLNNGDSFAMPASDWGPINQETGHSGSSLWNSIVHNIGFSGGGGGIGVNKADLFDINGDGRPDRIVQNGNSPLHVQINNGSGFQSSVQMWSGNVFDFISVAIGSPSRQWVDWAMYDINGDGLPDYVGRARGSDHNFDIRFNNGAGFDDEESWGPVLVPNTNLEEWKAPTSGDNDGQISDLIDMNGDGLPDRLLRSYSTPYDRFSLQVNTGSGFAAATDWGKLNSQENTSASWNSLSSQGFIGSLDKTSLLDINGDGLPDRIMRTESPPHNAFIVQLSRGPFPDLLCTVNNGIGGQIQVTYTNSTVFDNRDRDWTGDPWSAGAKSLLSFPVYVVTSVTAKDGMNIAGSDQKTTYWYRGGMFDPVKREFRGFNCVSATDVQGATTTNYFHQGGGRDERTKGEYLDAGSFAKKGIPYRTELWGSDHKLYKLTLNKVDEVRIHANGSCFPFISRTVEMDYEGLPAANVRAKAVGFVYDVTADDPNSTGNLIRQVNFGEVNNVVIDSNGGVSFNDNGSDTYYTHNSYTNLANPYVPIRNRPHSTKVTYDEAGTAGLLRENRLVYDLRGNLLKKYAWFNADTPGGRYGLILTADYDTYGNQTNTVDASSVRTGIVYDSNKSFPVSRHNSWLNSYELHDLSGNIVYSKDIKGLVATNLYDSFFRLVETRISTTPNGAPVLWKTKLDYSLDGIVSGSSQNFVRVRSNDATDANGHETFTYMDGLGRNIQTRVEGEAGKIRVSDQWYNSAGKVRFASNPYFGTALGFAARDESKPRTETYFDPLSRPNGALPPGDISGAPSGASYVYFNDGTDPWATVAQDAEGKIRTAYRNGLGQTYHIIDYLGSSPAHTYYWHDPFGSLEFLLDDAGNWTYLANDSMGRKVEMADPDMGYWMYEYDDAGRLTHQFSPLGTATFIEYNDVLGRLSAKYIQTWNAALNQWMTADIIEFGYDQSFDNCCTGYPGQLTGVVDRSGWEYYGYDVRGRLTAYHREFDDSPEIYLTQTSYDDADRIYEVTYPLNYAKVRYTYDTGGHIATVATIYGGGAPTTLYQSQTYGFDEANRPLGVTWGNGVQTLNEYYPNSKRLKRVQSYRTLSANFQDLTYTYDKVGNIKSLTDLAFLTGNPSANLSNIQYDDLHRLTSYTREGVATSFGYNTIGNLLVNGEFGAGTYTYGGVQPHAVTSANGKTYSYDDAGNMITRPGQSLLYDEENQLRQVNGITFDYDSSGIRLRKRVPVSGGVVENIWIGRHYELNDSRVLLHAWAGGQRIASFTPSGDEFYYYHPDHLGSTTVMTDKLGNLTKHYEYKAFGSERFTLSFSPVISQRYTGQVLDHETGLYYYNARYYDAELGRFIQPDSIIPDPNDSQSLNRYTYVLNNPLKLVDPSGHEVESMQNAAWFGYIPAPSGYAPYYRGTTFPDQVAAQSMNLWSFAVNSSWKAAEIGTRGLGMLGEGLEHLETKMIGKDSLLAFPLVGGAMDGTIKSLKEFNAISKLVKELQISKSISVVDDAAKTVATPYGPAVQSMTAEARAALSQVENGATLYKGGVLGRSETGASQFLSLENPLNPGYAGRYGIPPQNANFEFILTGRVQPGASVITRPAPGIPPNPGGGIEAVTTPGSFRIDSFHMP